MHLWRAHKKRSPNTVNGLAASIVTAVSAAPTNATAAPADASDEDDDGEIFFGSVTALECEKRVESIKAQAQRSQRYNVTNMLSLE